MRRRRGLFMMAAGIVLLAAAAGITAGNLLEERRAEKNAAHVTEVIRNEVILPQRRTNQKEGISEMPIPSLIKIQTVKVDDKDYIGILEIPRLGVTLPVMEDWSYPALRVAPCRYKGSYLENSMIIAGHNYKKHFGGLSQLEAGDTVYFTDVFDTVYEYQVSEIEILKGNDKEGMEEGEWDLTLFTCTLGGVNRVTVRCQAV